MTVILALLATWGCKDDPDPKGKPTPAADWSAVPTELIGVANLDDDDSDGTPDWKQAGVAQEDDLFALALPAGGVVDLGVSLGGDVKNLRVWLDGAVVLDATTTEATLAEVADGAELLGEFDGFLTEGTLTLSAGDETHVVTLLSAPLILNNHGQAGELEMAMSYSGVGGNRDMVTDFNAALADHFVTFDAGSYGWDVWVQDEVEFATLTAPDHRLDLVIDSIRTVGGGLDKLAEAEFEGPGVAVATWGTGFASSQDSFGNMEVTPPLTVDGVDYPFGRIYWGEWQGEGPVGELTDMLEAQKVQSPFQLDVSWLCVGHVDEFATFVPDASSAKGFKLLIANTTLGWDFLEEMGADYDLHSHYASGHGVDTVGDMLADEELDLYNQEIQAEIDLSREVLKQETGFEEEDIIDLPALFEPVRWCGGTAVSLVPGTINLTVYKDETGQAHLFMADPFFRGDDAEQGDDPFIAEIEALLPAGNEHHWVDDWATYHMGMGEVHCGTNTMRTPVGDWWDSAAHLLGGDQ